LLTLSLADWCSDHEGLLAIVAASQIAFETVAEPCRAAGYECRWLRGDDEPIPADAKAVLLDYFPSSAHVGELEDARLTDIVARAGAAKVILIMGYPRIDDLERAKRLGVADIVAKPFLAVDLLWRLARATTDVS
jgi:CheY-like chemotaxis protein